MRFRGVRGGNMKRMCHLLIWVVLVVSTSATLQTEGYAEDTTEIKRHVHTYLNTEAFGNWTFVAKPMFPVFLNDSQLQMGRNWSIVCPLTAGHHYHVYCYGEWIDLDTEAETDYDIYVYDPLGDLVGYHTESAGLPEHLGSEVDEPFFTPESSGNYSFVLRNDPRESSGSQQATFMLIENVACNVWHQLDVEGKEGDRPLLKTSWAWEFISESQHIEVLVRVPDTLDMYEARLYLMADPEAGFGDVLNEIPLPWEPGLYGDTTDFFGGYNLESKERRGVAYASCEFYGQNMLINFTSPFPEKSLYHLVLIAEAGSGTVDIVVKTDFDNPCLKPLTVPEKTFPHNDTQVAYISNCTDLERATLEYSTDDWSNTEKLQMEIVENRSCRAIIPGQPAGVTVVYRVEALDSVENILSAEGSYLVKHKSELNISLIQERITIGSNISVRGQFTPPDDVIPIRVRFTSTNSSREILCHTLPNGTFTATFRPETLGTWRVKATFHEDRLRYESASSEVQVEVEEPPFLAKYSMYIGGGLAGAAILGALIYWKKFRE